MRIAALAIVLGVVLGLPAFAGAATTVGQTFVPTTTNCDGNPDWEVVQIGRASGPSYAAPSSGVLTSWSFQSGTGASTLTLRVFRPTGAAHVYKVIADGGDLQTFQGSSGLHTLPTRVSVEAGDFVGIHGTSGQCGTATAVQGDLYDFRYATATPIGATNPFNPSSDVIFDISAALEPDADVDGYGDETQDSCPGDHEITSGPCQPTSTPVPPSTTPTPTRATISALSQTHPVFRVGATSTSLTGFTTRVYPRGTRFSLSLDQPATVIVRIQRKLPGRRVGRICRRPTALLRNRPRCTRLVLKATLRRSAHAGLNKIAFSGRIRGRALAPGRYRAAFTAANTVGTSPLRALNFRIAAP